jgi:hypothetical protein
VILLLPGTHLLMLLLLLLEARDDPLEPLGRAGIRPGMLAQHVGVAPQAAPAGDDLLERLIRGNELLELGRQRLEAAGRRVRQRAPPLPVLEGAARILEPAVQRRGVFRRHGRQPVPLHLQLGDPVGGVAAGQRLDLLADDDAVRLLARQRVGAVLFGRALLLPLGDRFTHRFARGFELLRQHVVEHLDVGLELRPRQPRLGQRRRGGVGIRQGDESLGAVQQRQRALAILGAHLRRRFGRDRPRRVLQQANARARPARRNLVARPLRDGAEHVGVVDPLEGGHRRIGMFRFRRDAGDLVGLGQPPKRPQPRRAVLRVAADRAERLLVLEQVDDRRADLGRTAVAGDDHDFPRAPERQQLPDDGRGVRRVFGLGGQPGETANGLGAHVFVGVGARDVTQHSGVVQPGHGGAANPGFRVLAGERQQRLRLIGSKVVNGSRADSRIGVLPARQGTEFFENAHRVVRSGQFTIWHRGHLPARPVHPKS